jgi:hypothetical protein
MSMQYPALPTVTLLVDEVIWLSGLNRPICAACVVLIANNAKDKARQWNAARLRRRGRASKSGCD